MHNFPKPTVSSSNAIHKGKLSHDNKQKHLVGQIAKIFKVLR